MSVETAGVSHGNVRHPVALPVDRFLILPALVLYLLLLGVPIGFIAVESLRPGLGAAPGTSWTFDNYLAFFRPQYASFFVDSILLSVIAAVVGIVLAYPVAHMLARTTDRGRRRRWMYLFVSALFLDVLIRTYAIVISLGPGGILPLLTDWFGIIGNDRTLIRAQVVIGLAYVTIPISALTLVGAIENINPNLCEAAQTLGASKGASLLATDVVLSMPAILSTFMLTFTLAMSAFIIPLVLGKGFVVFAANLIYDRFSELADFPSGAALSILVLLFSILVVYTFSQLARLVGRGR